METAIKEKKQDEILWLQILEAKPNKMFTEEQRQGYRFLRYSRFIECAECGKKRKVMWTMLCEFEAYTMESNGMSVINGKVHPPLTPVCGEHPLGPHFPNKD